MVQYVMNIISKGNVHQQLVLDRPFSYHLSKDPAKGIVFKALATTVENIETLDAGYFCADGTYRHLKQIVKKKEIVPFVSEGSLN